ncbi:MAG: hypothetical protein JO222_11325 [Frankiales bacterium]|nr:hypothetical protein [Frankiales bacterium]
MSKIVRRASRAAVLAGAVSLAAGVSLAGAQVAAAATTAAPVGAASAHAPSVKLHPMFMPTLANQWSRFTSASGAGLTPPAPPCPESGKLPSPFSNCGIPETPATGAPFLGNMAYWGGKVQVHPRVYLVFWGWGENGAFPGICKKERLTEGTVHATIACDPDGVAKRMADFVSQMGGTRWVGTQTQYYQVVNGKKSNIHNDKHMLGGIWADDRNRITAKVGYTNMAQEAERAAKHFHVAKKDLINADFVIAQPAQFSDPQAAAQGYCAFHDYTEPKLEGGIYNKVEPGLVYTNMPYLLSQGSGCGANLVNAGPAGRLDGVTIALGHEIMEAATDPGAEDILPDGTVIGGWFDPFDANENGDKCAYVGDDQGFTDPSGLAVPGAAGAIKGNRGEMFPVQSLWSNAAAGGAGYCAGTNYDLPF